ncbi:MAG TPA: 50S ribosomal protein L13 [Candidatus Binatia bacterium]
MGTFQLKKKDALAQRQWYVVDAKGQVLGRLATAVARVLRGKHKTTFTPHVDSGDFVIVINAKLVSLTGRKVDQKTYFRHSGYPGGIRSTLAGKMLDTKPGAVVQKAVKGMLPKNRLSRDLLRKLKVYAGPEHPHQAQNPQPLVVGG